MTVTRRLSRLRTQARRAWVLGRLRLVARLLRAGVDLDVAPDVEFGRRVQFKVQPRSRNSVTFGPGCAVHDDVVFLLKGGSVRCGEGVEIRRGCYFNLSGRLSLAGHNIISYYNVVHCAEAITFDVYSSTNEFVSIIDSTHDHDGPKRWFYENVRSAPIDVGRNSWICSKSSVLLGVTIGHNSVVGASSVVNRDVGDGVVVAGLPAKQVAQRKVAGPALDFYREWPPADR